MNSMTGSPGHYGAQQRICSCYAQIFVHDLDTGSSSFPDLRSRAAPMHVPFCVSHPPLRCWHGLGTTPVIVLLQAMVSGAHERGCVCFWESLRR